MRPPLRRNRANALADALEKNHTDFVIGVMLKRSPRLAHAWIDGEATLLHVAAARNRARVIGRLLELDANIDAIDGHGFTPLFVAARAGAARACAALLDAGARTDTHSFRQKSVLHMAAMGGSAECVRLVLQHSVPQRVPWTRECDNRGYTPMHVAAMCNNAECIGVLARDDPASVDLAHAKGTPLYAAAKYNAPLAVRALCEHGASFHTRKSNGLLPIHRAAYGGCLDAIDALLSFPDADVDAREQRSLRTPLMFAAHQGRTEAVIRLLERGAHMQAVDVNRHTALHRCVAKNHAMCVAAMLPLHNMSPSNGSLAMPLVLAAAHGHAETCAMLVDAGACPHAHYLGDTAIDVATRRRRTGVLAELVPHAHADAGRACIRRRAARVSPRSVRAHANALRDRLGTAHDANAALERLDVLTDAVRSAPVVAAAVHAISLRAPRLVSPVSAALAHARETTCAARAAALECLAACIAHARRDADVPPGVRHALVALYALECVRLRNDVIPDVLDTERDVRDLHITSKGSCLAGGTPPF